MRMDVWVILEYHDKRYDVFEGLQLEDKKPAGPRTVILKGWLERGRKGVESWQRYDRTKISLWKRQVGTYESTNFEVVYPSEEWLPWIQEWRYIAIWGEIQFDLRCNSRAEVHPQKQEEDAQVKPLSAF